MVVAFTIRRMTDGRQHYNAVTVAADQKGTPAVSPRDTPIAGERATSANTGVSSFVRQALGRVNADACVVGNSSSPIRAAASASGSGANHA